MGGKETLSAKNFTTMIIATCANMIKKRATRALRAFMMMISKIMKENKIHGDRDNYDKDDYDKDMGDQGNNEDQTVTCRGSDMMSSAGKRSSPGWVLG